MRVLLAYFMLGLLVPLLFFIGCQSVGERVAATVTPPPIEVKQPVKSLPEPKTADEWRAQKQQLLDQIDANDRAHAQADALLREQVAASDRRAEQADRDAQQATARTQAAWGRRIAFLCFAASVLCTILSFTPWGAIIPKWAGPAGMAGGVSILIAAACWVWVADHLLPMALGVGGIGALVALIVIFKSTLLLRIRQTYSHAMENATSEADELAAKANALEAELKGGVHALGQRLRGKAVKTWEDVVKLREAAEDKTRVMRIQPTDQAIR